MDVFKFYREVIKNSYDCHLPYAIEIVNYYPEDLNLEINNVFIELFFSTEYDKFLLFRNYYHNGLSNRSFVKEEEMRAIRSSRLGSLIEKLYNADKLVLEK